MQTICIGVKLVPFSYDTQNKNFWEHLVLQWKSVNVFGCLAEVLMGGVRLWIYRGTPFWKSLAKKIQFSHQVPMIR